MAKKVKVLKVYASDNGSLVANLDALDARPCIRRFIGWVYNAENSCFDKKIEAETIPYKHEYRQSIIDGDLIAADKETALICGIRFNQ